MKHSRFIISTVTAFLLGVFISSNIEAVRALIRFPDVRTGTYYADAAGNMAELGFITGYSNGNFGPDDPLTRAQGAVIMNRMWQELIRQGAVAPIGSQVVSSSSSSSSSVSSTSSSVSSQSSSSTSLSTTGNRFVFGVDKISIIESTPRLTISVKRIGDLNKTASVKYESENGTAEKEKDFTNTTGTLSFATGEENKTITINLKEDEIGEDSEVFYIKLTNPSTGYGIGSPDKITITINDNDGGPGNGASDSSASTATTAGKIHFSALQYGIAENKQQVNIRIVRTEGSVGSVTVDYVTKGIDATSSDFQTAQGTLTFADGVTEQTFTISVYDNSDKFGNKDVSLFLKNPTGGAIITQLESMLTIIDDDILTTSSGTGTFTMVENTMNVREKVGTFDVKIRRLNGTNGAVAIDYETVGNTANASSDFIQTARTLQFATGEMVKAIPVTIVADADIESKESFFVRIKNPTKGALLGSPAETVVNIE